MNKNLFLSLLLAALVLLLLFYRDPFGCKGPLAQTVDTAFTTIVKIDTQWIKQDTVFLAKETPKPVDSVPAPITIIDTTNESLLAQYRRMEADYNSVKTYQSPVELKDSTGRVVGTFNYKDKVNKNSIISREPNYQLTLPYVTKTVTNTVTITKQKPPKGQIYLGAEITGNKIDLVNGANVGILWKTKNDQIYTAGIGTAFIHDQPAVLQGKVGMYFKIGKKK